MQLISRIGERLGTGLKHDSEGMSSDDELFAFVRFGLGSIQQRCGVQVGGSSRYGAWDCLCRLLCRAGCQYLVLFTAQRRDGIECLEFQHGWVCDAHPNKEQVKLDFASTACTSTMRIPTRISARAETTHPGRDGSTTQPGHQTRVAMRLDDDADVDTPGVTVRSEVAC